MEVPEETIQNHSSAIFFLLFFKVLAIFHYLIISWFIPNFVLNFIIAVLLLSFDFWTVKNVSGRLLVGLRWWNRVLDDGTSLWQYENRKDTQLVKPIESFIFWSSLVISTIIWNIFFLVAMIRLRFYWLTVNIVAITYNLANLIGYLKCKKKSINQSNFWINQLGITKYFSNYF